MVSLLTGLPANDQGGNGAKSLDKEFSNFYVSMVGNESLFRKCEQYIRGYRKELNQWVIFNEI